MINHNAIYALYPNVISIHGDVALDKDNNIVNYDIDVVNSWIDPNEYKQKRLLEYPSIGDQLDALFHAGVFPSDMADKIQAVKDKYPKV